MAGETAERVSGWTTDTWAAHSTILREADAALQVERERHHQIEQDLRDKLQEEIDRRYAEVNVEREKALKIKETADRDALGLAREIQTYKDEKANELRSQIERERGSYTTQSDLRGAIEKVEATIKPIADYVASAQGRGNGLNAGWGYLLGFLGALGIIVVLVKDLLGK
jgi:hypothetical protein